MKFSQLLKGKRAERGVELPYVDKDGKEQLAPCLLVPLTGLEETEVLRFARDYAKAQGIENPHEGEPLYDLAVMVKSLSIGCLDTDSPKDAREPFFDGGVDQTLAELGREGIAYLYQRLERWQDDCSPQIRRVSANDLLELTVKLAEAEDDGPFSRLSPGLQWICTRFMARQLLALREDSSPPSSPSGPNGPGSRSAPASESSSLTATGPTASSGTSSP